MKILTSHLTGNANVKAAINGFIEADLLAEFHVTMASIPGSLLDKIGGLNALSEIRRRRFDPNVKPFLHTWPWFELGRLLSQKVGVSNKLFVGKTSAFNIGAVVQNFDRHVANSLKSALKHGVTSVYGYEDTIVQTFKQAKNLELECLYDLPIGYWRAAKKLLEIERERWPEWVSTMQGLNDSEEKLLNKEEELRMADRIFVASTFTSNTLKDFPGILAPVKVIPYGFPTVSSINRTYESFRNNRPIKLLFVGALSQRKGIADLFEAVKPFGRKVELTVVGRKTTEDCKALNEALSRHNWIPSLSHGNILQLMRESDVFVFPSLFEGFGLVITEAMSQGTPVITTERTAGPDLLTNNQNGWLIEAGSTQALINTISHLVDNPCRMEETGRAAMETARLRPWEIYGRELAAVVGGKEKVENTKQNI